MSVFEPLTMFRSRVRDSLVLKVVSGMLLMAFNAYIGRTLGAYGYGVFSFAIAICGVVLALVNLGWPASIARFVAEYLEYQSWSQLKGVINRSYQIVTITSLVASFVLVIFSQANIFNQEVSKSLLIGAVLLPFLALLNLNKMILQGANNIRGSIVPDEIVVPALAIAVMYCFNAVNYTEVALIYICVLLVGILLSGYWSHNSLPIAVYACVPQYRTKEWMLNSLPMVVAGLGQILLSRTDVLLVGSMLGLHDAGIYSAASRIALLITFFLMAINASIAAMLASAYYGGRMQECVDVYRRGRLWSIVGSLPLIMIVLTFPTYILSFFFGDNFLSASTVLQILAVGQLALVMAGSSGKALIMTGRARLYALPVFVAASFNMVGNYFVIPVWGTSGAATVTAMSQGLMAGLNYYFFRVVRKEMLANDAKKGQFD